MVKKREGKKPFKVLLYGKQGSGKTSVTTYAPGPVALLSYDDTDGILDRFDVNKNVEPFNLENKDNVLSETKQFVEIAKQGDYKTVVFDNLSALERIWFTSRANGKTKNDGANDLKDYGVYTNQLTNMLNYIDTMLGDRNIIYTAWEGTQEENLPSGQIITQHAPELRKDFRSYLMGTVNVVATSQIDHETKQMFWQMHNTMNAFGKNQLNGVQNATFTELFSAITADVNTQQKEEQNNG